MNSPHHPHHHHHDVHQQRLLWFFSFCNQRSSSSSNSSSSSTHSHGGSTRRALSSRRTKTSSRNKFALQYQQQLQKQQRQSSNVFGMDLIEHTRRFGDHEDSIPFIVKSCAQYIEKHGIIFGIYRLSGMRVNIHKLRQDFDKNPKISMIDSESITNDSHAVACVLKQYFRELPTPLLTFHMYEKFIELFKHSSCAKTKLDDEDDQIITTTTVTPTKIMTSADGRKLVHNRNKTVSNKDKSIEQFQNIDDDDDGDDDDVDVDRGDSARTISDKTIVSQKPITKQPPTVTTTMSTSSFISNASKACASTTASTHIIDKSTSTSPTSKQPIHQQSLTAIEFSSNRTAPKHHHHPPVQRNRKFTSSASDSQLISLSSVVTTTTADVKYQVRLDELKQLLLQLPRAHYQTLKFLMRHLAFIAANGQKTGMDSKNVAIVWAPNLLKPRELELSAGHIETLQVIGLQAVITEQLIKHHKFLFDDEFSESLIERGSVDRVSSSDANDNQNNEKDQSVKETTEITTVASGDQI